jgi:hypothetical protein
MSYEAKDAIMHVGTPLHLASKTFSLLLRLGCLLLRCSVCLLFLPCLHKYMHPCHKRTNTGGRETYNKGPRNKGDLLVARALLG